MVSPIRKEITFRQAKPPIQNSILSNHTPPYTKKGFRFYGIPLSLRRIDLYYLSFIFYLLSLPYYILLLGEDYDTVPVVCAVRLNIRSVVLDCETVAADSVSVHKSVSDCVGTFLGKRHIIL